MADDTTGRRLLITLAGMRFHVRVGVLPHERELAQPLELDLTVRLVAEATAVLDYRSLYAIVNGVVAAERLDYLESIGDVVATKVMALDGVAGVRVAVRKPHVSLGGPLAYAEIVVERGS
jgi:dihydroneopterin aldolase